MSSTGLWRFNCCYTHPASSFIGFSVETSPQLNVSIFRTSIGWMPTGSPTTPLIPHILHLRISWIFHLVGIASSIAESTHSPPETRSIGIEKAPDPKDDNTPPPQEGTAANGSEAEPTVPRRQDGEDDFFDCRCTTSDPRDVLRSTRTW